MTGAFVLMLIIVTAVAASRATHHLGARRVRVPMHDRQRPAGSADERAQRRRLGGEPPGWLSEWLQDAGLDLAAERVWPVWLTIAVAGPVVASVVTGIGGGFGAAVVVSAGPVVALRARRGRGAARYEAALAPALEAVARSLRSGAGLRQALSEAATSAPPALDVDLRRVVSDADLGVGVVSALDAWVDRRPLRGVQLTCAALALGAEAGGAQARAVDGVAATMRQRARAEAEARALGAQARMSAGVIAAAPVVFAALAAALDPSSGRFLFRTVPGAVLLVAGIGLDLLGTLWMARLSRVTRP